MLESNIADQLDLLIRSGQVHRASREIYSIFKSGKITETEKSTFANLARRSGLPLLSLKILTPIISKDKLGLRSMSKSEMLSYAAGLIALGAHQEGEELLLHPELKNESQSWFFLGISAMNQWEYQKAKKYFLKYLQSSNLTSYQIQTARLNLSTSMLVIGDLDSARQIIEAAMESIHPEKEKLLQFYFLEQKVQWLIAEKKYDQALLIIQKIQSQEKDLPENYKLTLKKWHLASAFYSKKINTEQLSNDLNLLENEAYQRSMPELLREIDFYRSLFLKDPSAYSRIYFGTSWKPYLKRLEENLGQQKHPTSFLWNPRPWQKISDGSTGTTFDIQRPMNVRYNSMQHKLLWVLSSDLYRQHSLGSLFHSLYPNEKFDPWTSKDRIMKLLRRTQVVIPSKSNEYSLKILHKKNKFYLSFDCELLLPLRPRHLPIEIQQDPLLVAIYNIKKYRPFTNEDIRKISDLSESQTYEDLKKIFAKGYIQQLKKRGQTTYCITKKLFPHPAQ